MYVYNIGYGSYEESHYWQFLHEKKYSEDELFDVAEECLFECLKNELKSKKKRRKELELEIANSPKEERRRLRRIGYLGDDKISLADLFYSGNRLFIEEMKKRGFEKLEFQAGVSVFGWNSALDPDDWKIGSDNWTKRMVLRLRRRRDAHSMYKRHPWKTQKAKRRSRRRCLGTRRGHNFNR